MSKSATHESQATSPAFCRKCGYGPSASPGNRAAAEDLVQDVAVKVLLANPFLRPGHQLLGVGHKIMINHFISSVRNTREHNDLDQAPEISVMPRRKNAPVYASSTLPTSACRRNRKKPFI